MAMEATMGVEVKFDGVISSSSGPSLMLDDKGGEEWIKMGESTNLKWKKCLDLRVERI